jgi:hypothetical protein
VTFNAAVSARMTPGRRFAYQVSVGWPGGCWMWEGSKRRGGYGRVSVDGQTRLVHRWAYEEFVGPIPAGLTLDHLCRNRACVNPDHLEPVTLRENTLRGTGPTSTNATKDACPKGHPFDEANTWLHNGRRYCRTCRRDKARDDQRRRRAAAR